MKPKFDVIWSNSAAKDLEDIILRLSIDSPLNARRIFSEITTASSALYQFPERGRFVPELYDRGILQYRELIIPPWRIIYRVVEKTVFVLTVLDSRRNVEDILLNKLIDGE
jgi:toxin ParE1/3/4